MRRPGQLRLARDADPVDRAHLARGGAAGWRFTSGAISTLLPALAGLSRGEALNADFALVTLTHCRMGEATFGISPGEGDIWATLRTVTNDRMRDLVALAEALVAEHAAQDGLTFDISYDDEFDACTNHPEAVALLNGACQSEGRAVEIRDEPQRWSEDFGQFSRQAKCAMFWLGSGETQAQLHNPDFDFPDAVIPVGTGIFKAAITTLLVTPNESNH